MFQTKVWAPAHVLPRIAWMNPVTVPVKCFQFFVPIRHCRVRSNLSLIKRCFQRAFQSQAHLHIERFLLLPERFLLLPLLLAVFFHRMVDFFYINCYTAGDLL